MLLRTQPRHFRAGHRGARAVRLAAQRGTDEHRDPPHPRAARRGPGRCRRGAWRRARRRGAGRRRPGPPRGVSSRGVSCRSRQRRPRGLVVEPASSASSTGLRSQPVPRLARRLPLRVAGRVGPAVGHLPVMLPRLVVVPRAAGLAPLRRCCRVVVPPAVGRVAVKPAVSGLSNASYYRPGRAAVPGVTGTAAVVLAVGVTAVVVLVEFVGELGEACGSASILVHPADRLARRVCASLPAPASPPAGSWGDRLLPGLADGRTWVAVCCPVVRAPIAGVLLLAVAVRGCWHAPS